jgi:hypothetical protein
VIIQGISEFYRDIESKKGDCGFSRIFRFYRYWVHTRIMGIYLNAEIVKRYWRYTRLFGLCREIRASAGVLDHAAAICGVTHAYWVCTEYWALTALITVQSCTGTLGYGELQHAGLISRKLFGLRPHV